MKRRSRLAAYALVAAIGLVSYGAHSAWAEGSDDAPCEESTSEQPAPAVNNDNQDQGAENSMEQGNNPAQENGDMGDNSNLNPPPADAPAMDPDAQGTD